MADRFELIQVPPELHSDTTDIEDVPLRETYAHRIRPIDRAALEHLCAAALELARELPRVPDPTFEETFATAAADLRSLEAYLRHAGASEGDDLDRRQRQLASTAEQLAEPVAEVARQLEAASNGVEP